MSTAFRPQLRPDLVIVEQTYRGEQMFIVKDPETLKYFRFKPLEAFIMQQFDGKATSPELARALETEGIPVTAATLDGFARKLARMGLLVRSLAEKSVLQLERLRAERRRRVRGTHYHGSLLRMRWSVGDPDRLLERWMPRFQFFFRPPFIAFSVALFATYFAIAAVRWSEITAGVAAMYSASFYTLENVLLAYGTGVIIIIIHEFGHGFSCKHFGGRVHEMGAMLIYFNPAFYCNVNDAWTFTNRAHRLWVTAAGTWIQLVIAGIAAVVWVLAQPDTLVSRIAFFAVIFGGATTFLANANPLIPLDGYYALSDLLEIPNLRQRAFGHLAWWLKRHVLRLTLPEPPADDLERRAFLIYGTAATAYISLIFLFIGGLVLGWFRGALGFVGVLAFVALVWLAAGAKLREWGRAAVTSVREHRLLARLRARGPWLAGGAGLLALVLLVIPWPLLVSGRFVAAPARQVVLGTVDNAIIARVDAREGERVAAGQPIVVLRSFALEAEGARTRRVADSLAAAVRAARAEGAAALAERVEQMRAEVEARARGLEDRLAQLVIRAPFTGTVTTPRLHERLGAAIDAGEPVVQLAELDSLELRVPLDEGGARVMPGQRARIISHVGWRQVTRGVVASVGRGGASRFEARVRVPAGTAGLQAGGAGEVRITVRRSNLAGALLWAVRKRLRNDLLL